MTKIAKKKNRFTVIELIIVVLIIVEYAAVAVQIFVCLAPKLIMQKKLYKLIYTEN